VLEGVGDGFDVTAELVGPLGMPGEGDDLFALR
jgi:hypothetical protein